MPLANPGHDPGYNGRLMSLGGVIGREGLGLVVENKIYTETGIATQLIPSNPARYWLIMRNIGTLRTNIAFGPDGGGYATANHIYLEPGDVFQIDRMIPWTGSISCFAAGDVLLSVAEASVTV